MGWSKRPAALVGWYRPSKGWICPNRSDILTWLPGNRAQIGPITVTLLRKVRGLWIFQGWL